MSDLTLQADCPATQIPAGTPVTIPTGSVVHLTQALGNSITVRDGGGIYRVERDAFPAFGEAVAQELRAKLDPGEAPEGAFSEDLVWAALKQCFDPEIPVNIVDLGLIYDMQIVDAGDGQHAVAVKMTLTAVGCGMGPTIAADAREKVLQLPTVREAEVEIVWDPQWTPHMISAEGREILGLE